MGKTLVILSGGMDSTVALVHSLSICKLGEKVKAITFNYGSKHNERENEAARAICDFYKVDHKIVHLPFINDLFKSDLLRSGGDIPDGHYADDIMKKTVVPFRNGIMLSIAAGYAESIGASTLVLGNHSGDHAIYPDCRPDFSIPMREAIFHGTYLNVVFENPFVSMVKARICNLGHHLGVPFELTYSCYKGREKHCGTCGTCNERKEAFQLSGVKDNTEYEV